ncbi:MAG: hypothetical protein KDI17_10340 [Halioglobus sp.]|nr:hypothetical protein [Halioglobus sp.]
MKLRFLCANHREWLFNQPEQALHRCADSFETGWHLCQTQHWRDALAHMGCAFESAEILMTSRGVAPTIAVDWFLKTLDGLLRILEKLQLMDNCVELYQVAIGRLRQEANGTVSPQLEADLYMHITRLNRDRRRLDMDREFLPLMAAGDDARRADIVLH